MGGGTDLKQYYEKYGGMVISFAIDIYYKFTMYYDDNQGDYRGQDNTVPYGGKQDFVFKILDHWNIDSMHHTNFSSEYDGFVGGGLGGSSSALCAIIAAISKRLNLNYSKLQIVKKAYELSPNFGGMQDQMAATFGGANLFRFTKDGIFIRKLNLDKILPSILLFSTDIRRQNPKIQEGLKELTQVQIDDIHELKGLTYDALEAIEKGDIKELGKLMDKSWVYKKSVNKGVTNPQIDNFYNKAKEYGALGFKLCGSGGGGFCLCIVDPNDRVNFVKNMEQEGLENWDYNLCRNGVMARQLPIGR